jgi:membrane-anchored glycerophosphoryl diester phosphodiesterase (GDPDase)
VSDKQFNIIGGDGKEYGPYTLNELRDFYDQGRLNMASQVKEDDLLGEWQPLGDVLDAGRAVMPDFAEHREMLLESNHRLQLGEAIERGWEATKSNFFLLWAVFIVYFVISVGISFVPVVGGLIQWVISGPLMGGMLILVLKALRNNDPEFPDLFEGFKSAFASLFGVYVIQTILGLVLLIPGIAMLVIGFFPLLESIDSQDQEATAELFTTLFTSGLFIGGILYLVMGSWILNVLIYWTLPLVADKGFGVFESFGLSIRIAGRNFFRIFVFYFISMVVMVLSAIPIGLGLILTIPLVLCASMHCYEQMFSSEYNE